MELWKCFILDYSLYSLYFLTVKEEEALIAAHRKEIQDTMEIVREVSGEPFLSLFYNASFRNNI